MGSRSMLNKGSGGASTRDPSAKQCSAPRAHNISFDLALRESHLLTFLNSFIVVSRAFASDLLIFLRGCPPPGKAPQRHGGLPSSGKSTYNSPSMEDNPLILDNILLSSPNRS